MAVNGSTAYLFVYDKDYAGTKFTDKYILIAEQTGLSKEESSNLIETSNKNSNHTQFIYGRSDATISFEANLAVGIGADEKGLEVLKKSKAARKPIYIKRAFYDGTNFTDVEYAECLIEKLSLEFPDDDVSTVSVDLQVSGGMLSSAPTIDDTKVQGSN